jgi:hypothetical protein
MKAAQTVIGLGLALLFPHCGGPSKLPPVDSTRSPLDPDLPVSLAPPCSAAQHARVPDDAVEAAPPASARTPLGV